MSAFWTISRRVLRHRAVAGGALAMAFVSAAGLGAGLIGLVPVLDNILGAQAPTLREQVTAWAGRLPWGLGERVPREWLDALPTDRFDAVVVVVSVLGVLTALGATANFLHAYLSLTLTTRVIAELRRGLFRRLVHLPLSVVVQGRGADLTSRVLNDTSVLARGLGMLTSKAIAQALRGAAALVTAFVINWQLSLATLVVAPVLGVVIRKLGKRIRRASQGAMQGQAQLLEVAGEVTRGFRVVKVHTAERAEIGRFSRYNREVVRQSLRMRTAQALASPLIETITILVLGGLALIAAKAIIDGELRPTEFLVTMGALGLAGTSLRPLTSILQEIQVADAAAARLLEVLAMPPEEAHGGRRPRLGPHRRSIEFRDVSFTYPGAESSALRGVSLTIEHGQTVAFVGPNGCGKTTLLSLVPRLYAPVAGAVLVDGVDIAGVSLRSLRRQIGVVPQEPVLFRGTIASNIAYGVPGASLARIEEAARLARAHAFIAQLPRGYDTSVGDQGLTLSGGQRQRLAIARALLRDPSILIMDEATSMIDSESEAQIAQAVASFAATRTCLLVAHRLTTVLGAGRIVVMEGGRIIDQGRHDELLERCQLYRELTRHQLAPALAAR